MSWPIAAALVIGIVLLVLVGGVFVARRGQSNDATQVAISTAQPTGTRATVSATAPPTFVATTAPTTAATPQVATPVTTTVQGSTPVAAATPVAAGASGGATPAPTQAVSFS